MSEKKENTGSKLADFISIKRATLMELKAKYEHLHEKMFYRTSREGVPNSPHSRRRHLLQDPNRVGVQRSTGGPNRRGNHIWLGCSCRKGLRRQHMHVYQADKRLRDTVEDQGEDDQLDVCSEFRENIVKRSDGQHKVGVPWVLGAELSNTNEMASRKRLENVERKLRRNEDLKIEY